LKYGRLAKQEAEKQKEEDNRILGEAHQNRIRLGQVQAALENKEEDVIIEGTISKCFEV
jgi:hypothetical protein